MMYPNSVFVVQGGEPLLNKDPLDGRLPARNCHAVSRRHDHVRIGGGTHSVIHRHSKEGAVFWPDEQGLTVCVPPML
jgi:hypothetical protein